MANYNPPYKIILFLCFSVATTVAKGGEMLDNPDSHVAEQSHEALIDDYQSHLAGHEEHPWCGTERIDEYEVSFLVNDGDGGHHFITADEYEKLIAEGLEEA